MELIEKTGEFSARFGRWNANEDLVGYPWVENIHSPFVQVRRALPMLNLALITSTGAFIDRTVPFDLDTKDGDVSFREIPIEVEAADLRFSAKGFDPKSVIEDRNSEILIDRLLEYQANSVIGSLNSVWWSISSYIPNAKMVSEDLAPKLADLSSIMMFKQPCSYQLRDYATRHLELLLEPLSKAVYRPLIYLLIPRSPTRSVRRELRITMVNLVQSPESRTGENISCAFDETIRWIETFDQPGSRKLAVDLESQVEAARGER